MLFDRGRRSRPMIGFRDDRQITPVEPAGRSSQGMGALPCGESARSRAGGGVVIGVPFRVRVSVSRLAAWSGPGTPGPGPDVDREASRARHGTHEAPTVADAPLQRPVVHVDDAEARIVAQRPLEVCLLYTSPSPRDRTRSR